MRSAGLRVAFQVTNLSGSEAKDNPEYIRYITRVMHRSNQETKQIILKHRKCTESDLEDFGEPTTAAETVYSKIIEDETRNLYCIDLDEQGDLISIYGDRSDDAYQRLDIIVAPCNYLNAYAGHEGDMMYP